MANKYAPCKGITEGVRSAYAKSYLDIHCRPTNHTSGICKVCRAAMSAPDHFFESSRTKGE